MLFYLIRLILLSLDHRSLFFFFFFPCYYLSTLFLVIIKAESLLLDAMSVVYQDRVNHHMDPVHGVLAHTSLLRTLLLHLLDHR